MWPPSPGSPVTGSFSRTSFRSFPRPRKRRFPFGAPVAVAAAVILASLVDDRLTPTNFIVFFAGCAAVILVALLRDRRQAVAGLAIVIGTEAVVERTDPEGGLGNFLFISVISPSYGSSALRWGGSSRKPTRRETGRSEPSANVRSVHGLRSPRSARGSRESCTTSSVTASAS
jgi:hypothetical protein